MGAPVYVVDHYAIYDKIASGGMAGVHFGRLLGAVGFSRTVAVKRLHPHLVEDPEFTSAMIDEARLAARIHHPNVVPTLDVVATDGEVLVVMEYVRGESLARLLRAESTSRWPVPLPITSAIVIGALHGLHAAHEATGDRGAPLGIVHRDVSPQNILVGVDGLARIIDFGVAKAAGRLQTTREGVVKGKIAYMAPEQLGANEVTRAVDVYAMGVVLWEMLAGRRLFDAASEGELLRQVIQVSHDAPGRHSPNVPPELDALVMKALAKEASARFATAQEMADALRRIVPPAFPTDVGRWVQDVAADALARRGEQLAEIESNSSVIPVPASEARPRVSKGARVEASTVVPEPSSVSAVETRSEFDPRSSHRARRAALAAVFVTVAMTAGIVWRMGRPSTAPTAGEGALPVASASPPAARESLPEPSLSASAPAVPPAPSTQLAAPATTGSTPARAPRRHLTPKPAPSILFAQPD